MTRKREQLIYLVSAIILAVFGAVGMIVASIQAFNTSSGNYAHSIEIKKVDTQLESVNGVTYHFVTIDGDIINNTNKKFDTISVEITFSGIDNNTGEAAEFLSGFTIENFNANSKVDIQEKVLKVGNFRGFIPESVKSIKLILPEGMEEIPFEKTGEGSLLLFGGALVIIFVSGLLFAKWNNKRKTATPTEI